MVLTDFSSRPGVRILPGDLTCLQRRGLAASALVLHAVVGFWVWNAASVPVVPTEPVPLIVNLLSEPQAEFVPERRPVAEPYKPRPTQSAPLPPVSMRETPKVVAAARQAQPQDMQVPIVAPQPQTTPAVMPQTAPSQPAVTEVAAPVKSVAPPSEAVHPAAPKVLKSSTVCYLVRPLPVYPLASQELGEEGTVIVRVLVDEQGKAKEVNIEKSSGYPRLDRAAIAAEKTARYRPYTEGGVVRMGLVTHPTTFTLTESDSNERNKPSSNEDCR